MVSEGGEEVSPDPRPSDKRGVALGTAVLRGHWPVPQQAEGRAWCWAKEGQDCLTAKPRSDPAFWENQMEALPRASSSLSMRGQSRSLLQLATLSVLYLSPQPGQHNEKPKEEKVP